MVQAADGSAFFRLDAVKSLSASHRDGADENRHCSAWPFPHRIATSPGFLKVP
jgi:hypothetical protein